MYGGIFDTIQSYLDDFGISGESALAVAKALASPTTANINAVKSSFEVTGNAAPPELLNALYARQAESYKDNLFFSAGSMSGALPWIIAGGIVAFVLYRRRR